RARRPSSRTGSPSRLPARYLPLRRIRAVLHSLTTVIRLHHARPTIKWCINCRTSQRKSTISHFEGKDQNPKGQNAFSGSARASEVTTARPVATSEGSRSVGPSRPECDGPRRRILIPRTGPGRPVRL
ncbi:hypothetical protein Taro_006385, partial [Colocasia esculenta]|nr:hypothetical protein [Colocasia esculenta]